MSSFTHERRPDTRAENWYFHELGKEMTQTATRKVRRSREPGLLTTESRETFLRFRKAYYDEIQPRNAIERHFVDWIAMLAWEILRFVRIKAELINCALFEALKNLLMQADSTEEFGYRPGQAEAAEDLAARWFVDDEAKAEVAALLARLGLDETAIEAGAYRLRAAEIESVDRLLTSKERSLDKALRFIGKLRKNLGERLRQSSAERFEETAPPIVVAEV
jgi:hypothetical protein